jgi:hypothetical protein
MAFWLVSGSALAGTLDEKDVARLHADIAAIYQGIESGDAKPFIALTHESLFALVGGKDALEAAMLAGFEQLRSLGARILSAELGAPSQTYAAGAEEVCFVPRIALMEVGGKKAKVIGFMVAIRRLGTDDWKYLDGGGLRKNRDLLHTLLPDLVRGIEFPPNRIEPL